MDQSNASESPTNKRTQSATSSRMSPLANTSSEGNQDASPSENTPSNDQARPGTPLAPLLRPAQGAWDRAYGFSKPLAPSRTSQTQSKDGIPQTTASAHPRGPDLPGPSSPALAHTTRSKDTSSKRREPSAPATPGYSGQEHGSRVTHPESAQRHSQASGLVSGVQPPSHSYSSHEPPREHYRSATYARSAPSSVAGVLNHSPTTVSTPQYHPEQPPGAPPPRAPHHEHPRAPAPQPYAPSNYYPSAPTYSHQPPQTAHTHYPQHRTAYPEPDPYSTPAPRNQTSAYPNMNYTQEHDDPAPIVVLLMEDIRFAGPEPDFQLAEVSVSLRPQVGEEGGWWADGEEVMKALQLTPSRLEGAAKVFARRGKYRQCFVRFSEDGTMECQPSSLMVSREKTIELIIEPNLEGRATSRETYPLSMPQHEPYLRTYTSPTVGPSQPPRGTYDDYPPYGQPQAQLQLPLQSQAYPSQQYYPPSQGSSGKRNSAEMVSNVAGDDHQAAKRAKTAQASLSSTSSKRPSQPRQPASSQSRPSTANLGAVPGPGPSTLSLGSLAQATPTTRVSSPEEGQEPVSPYGPFLRHETLPITNKAPKEVVNAAIVAYLRSHIQNEDGYIDFAASKGRLLPIPDLLRGYRFATRIVNTWANRKTPPAVEGCPNKRITKNHVLQALFRQTSWGSDCEQTLQLADRYGPGGPREDPRVVEILNGGSMLPEKSGDKAQGRSQGSVALLDFLKDVDKEHKARQEEELRKSVSSGGKDVVESGSRGEGESGGD
ncbi:hypothetical protein K439DRAFT_1123698 [Ramaria rubella]|nr:hypothetical protein K439DRAFT_1123698 [Ramaria rubella]